MGMNDGGPWVTGGCKHRLTYEYVAEAAIWRLPVLLFTLYVKYVFADVGAGLPPISRARKYGPGA